MEGHQQYICALDIKCDRSVTWSGWYRLFINGLSAHIPETCISAYGCGTYGALGIPDGHPTVDGVVTREACAQRGDFCSYVRSIFTEVILDKIPQLDTTNSSVDIGIAKNNNERSAAVDFMSYNMMEEILKPDFFNTPKDTVKTMMSTVISATLPKTTNTKLTKPVNFTFRHIREFDPNTSLLCVYWNIREDQQQLHCVFLCSSVNIRSHHANQPLTRIMALKTLAQCVVLGCPWILGFFSKSNRVLEILFLILNSQQGTFIFLIYCVLNNERDPQTIMPF
ncbi:Adhesion G protein-coupled receptor E2 [Labeo rohita]|uniref:Adhesion G protein-coupled receptor E2 n=1 Tax=Labeo rohita TaxID=84645 RepID=A0ABQ8N1I8_LABRO|nr:Adhesion G protein-coupled receptor E2 [Labeo rohita]